MISQFCRSLNDWTWVSDFCPEVCQIGLKWDKSGDFSTQISVHFDSVIQNVLKSDLKKKITGLFNLEPI